MARILIVDDCPDTRLTFRLLLSRLGHEVREAADGPRALELAGPFCPDVVLLDIGLPGMDGFEVARRLRELPALASAVLVAVTGHGQPEDVERCRQAGFRRHLLK